MVSESNRKHSQTKKHDRNTRELNASRPYLEMPRVRPYHLKPEAAAALQEVRKQMSQDHPFGNCKEILPEELLHHFWHIGIRIEDFQAQWDRQQGKCALCRAALHGHPHSRNVGDEIICCACKGREGEPTREQMEEEIDRLKSEFESWTQARTRARMKNLVDFSEEELADKSNDDVQKVLEETRPWIVRIELRINALRLLDSPVQ